MKAEHLEILVEEPSMETFLMGLLPRLLGEKATWSIHVHRGKTDLLKKLAARLRSYSKWLPEAYRIVVLVDRDDDDCKVLKQQIEEDAKAAALVTRAASNGEPWQLVNRIAIEELEAWYFGEWTGVRKAYPKVAKMVSRHASYRNPDAITGGTWEAFERILARAGYFSSGLRKVEVAQAIGEHFDATIGSSPSFVIFRDALLEAIT